MILDDLGSVFVYGPSEHMEYIYIYIIEMSIFFSKTEYTLNPMIDNHALHEKAPCRWPIPVFRHKKAAIMVKQG